MQRQYQTRAGDYLMQEGDRIGSWVLSQVGSHIQKNPFGKVKQMIQQMVEKLLDEQAEEAEHKTWCDGELTKTKKLLGAKKSKLEDISTKIEKAKATSAKLEGQIKALAAELADLDTQDQQATEMRQREHENFKATKKDLQGFQDAIATAIKVLKSYYSGKSFMQKGDASSMASLMQERSGAEQPAGGAAASVLGLLEVAESDFSKALAESQAAEDAAQQEYDEMIQDNKVSRAEKKQDQKSKQAEKGRLDNLISETKLDSQDATDELSAVMEYLDKLKGGCETTASSFEQRQARRKQEMESLQNALAILEGKAMALLETEGAGTMPSAASLLRR
jgi:chromosome segregation ATPase